MPTAAKKKPAAATKKPAARKAAANDVVEGLRAVAMAHADQLVVKSSSADGCYLVSKKPYAGKELFFAAVRNGKAYVSYHFFPLYLFPALLKGMSPALKKRMQGKTCFNFKEADAALFAELGELTRRGFEAFRDKELL
jgi:hypothetical protein